MDTTWNAEPYLRYLAAECNRLRLSVVDPQYVTPTGEAKITLAQVYTDLDVTAMVAEPESQSGPKRSRSRQPDTTPFGEPDERRRLTALEAVEHPATPHIVLLGDPGGGKSTFINYLAFCLAMARLEPKADWLERLPGWTQGTLLPVRVVLRELIAWADTGPGEPGDEATSARARLRQKLAAHFDREELRTLCFDLGVEHDNLPEAREGMARELVEHCERHGHMAHLTAMCQQLRPHVVWESSLRPPNAQTLWDFIQHDLTSHGLGEEFAPLKRQLQTESGLILLDGLDEVPDAQQRREWIKAVVEDFARGCGLCRIIVTCRVYAYQKTEWKLEGFTEFTLAPFSPEQIERFITRWYETVRLTEGWNEATAQAKASALLTATRQPYLFELAQRPLLLTLMATLHTSRGKLPDDRADLYADCVRLLLDYWQRGKVTLVAGQRQTEDGVLDALGLPRSRLEQALSQVAFEAHLRQARAADRQPETADISGDELRKALAPALNDSLDNASKVIYYIQTRAGLLSERGADTYAFPHRTFQEFLAACHALDSDEFPYDLADLTCRDREWWREVFLLAAGRARSTVFGQAVALINALCDQDYQAGQRMSDDEAYTAALAAQAGAEVRLPERAREPGKYRKTLARLQGWLVGIIEQGKLPLQERAEAGRLLSALGDPRSDVACPIPALVTVPAGGFIMGGDKYDDEKPPHRVTLPEYRIGQYPVTNAQYRRFVEDGGYTDKWRACWTEAGWRWREKENVERPPLVDDPQWNLDNHPVVGVAWYEAVAYCNWLTRTDPEGRTCRLPTEAEWEKAARGPSTSSGEGREWPWGNEFDLSKTNTAESGIGRTTVVGLFPRGQSVYGTMDMAGNVREWCQSLYRPYPYQANDGREDLQSEDYRVLRGGSFLNGARNVRGAYRDRNNPRSRFTVGGFRRVLWL